MLTELIFFIVLAIDLCNVTHTALEAGSVGDVVNGYASCLHLPTVATSVVTNMSISPTSEAYKPKGHAKKLSLTHVKQKIGLGTVKAIAPEIYSVLKISLRVSVEALEKAPIPGLKAAGTGLLSLLKAIDVIHHQAALLSNGEWNSNSLRFGNQNREAWEDIDRTLNQNGMFISFTTEVTEICPVRDGTPESLPYVPARYKDQRENKQISTCLPNTRVELLRMIDDWVHDRKKPPIFWLSGMAGTGKSTIAKTFAQSLDGKTPQDYLGASFFCSRDEEKLSRDYLIIPNIAYQLAQYDEGFHSGVSATLQVDPNAADLDLENQFQRLILEPLQNTTKKRTLIVIVMDALDECSGKPEEIVALFSSPQLADLPFSIKLFVTGRPEAKIRQALAHSNVKSRIQPLQLHEIEGSIVKGDIMVFLNHHFKLMVDVRPHLPTGWPPETNRAALGDLAGDLFIFAATAIKFIDNPEEDPEDKLSLILTNVHSRGQIDPLYKQVLDFAFDKNGDNDLLQHFQNVMGTIVHLREPLTIRGLRMLLNISSSSVRKVISRLYSVIIIPDTEDEYIRLIHPSFPDYLTDERRCTDRKYFINKARHHTDVACCALRCMLKGLERNICKLEEPLTLNQEILDLPRRLASHIPSHLRYSCFYWGFHVSSVDPTDEILELLHSFCTTKLLAWLEVLILYGQIDIALGCIRLVRKWLSVSNPLSILDAIVTCFFSIKWNPCLSILRGHSDDVRSVSFSPDGSKIISASDDTTMRIWDVTTGTALSTFNDSSSLISSVAFTPDGSKIVSGSHNGALKIWDSKTGIVLSILTGHSDVVNSIEISPDGFYIVSASSDKTARVWGSGRITTFTGHQARVKSAAFSPDQTKVVSGGHDNALRIWDSKSGVELNTLKGHTYWVNSVAFSPDGMKIISGSDDRTVRIWDSITGKTIAKLKGHLYAVLSVAFSLDGAKIVSGGHDNDVRIWDSSTGRILSILDGHSRAVTSFALSPDQSKVVSGSQDRTVRIWDLTSEASLTGLDDHSDWITSA
ncbi:13029_t:CDS:2, partial [Acaulospora colombiana]